MSSKATLESAVPIYGDGSGVAETLNYRERSQLAFG
jgi:hypothetical protein